MISWPLVGWKSITVSSSILISSHNSPSVFEIKSDNQNYFMNFIYKSCILSVRIFQITFFYYSIGLYPRKVSKLPLSFYLWWILFNQLIRFKAILLHAVSSLSIREAVYNGLQLALRFLLALTNTLTTIYETTNSWLSDSRSQLWNISN